MIRNIATLNERYINQDVNLPYGVTIKDISSAVAETYRLLNGINSFLTSSSFDRLEFLLLGNSLSGIISEFIVKNLANCSPKLEANEMIGGHPDLLPIDHYPTNKVLRGEEGIEVKASIQKGGWQGHNPEESWMLIFRYVVGEQKNGEKVPFEIIEILSAKLEKGDWL